MGKLPHDRQNNKEKKLSWIYRKKAKLRRQEKTENLEKNEINNADENGQNSRIIVRNLSFQVTEKDVRRFYEPFGEITEVNLLKRPDGNLIGCGFIRFKRVEDASKAIFNTNKKELLGRTIYSDWAISKSRFCEKLEKSVNRNEETDKNETTNKKRYFSLQHVQDEEHKEHKEHDEHEKQNSHIVSQKEFTKEKNNLKKRNRKLLKKIKQNKRARIVIRNLSFQVTEDNLKEHFSQYGNIEEIKILTKPDGKKTGVAFLQFNIVQSAAKAIHYANMKPLLDRPMVVDWAVSKKQFSQNNANVKSDIKSETIGNESHDVPVIKIEDENNSDSETDSKEVTVETIKINNESDENAEIKYESEDMGNDEDTNNDANDDNDDDDDDDDDNDNNDDNNVNITINLPKKEKDNCSDTKHSRRISNDVNEGKTVFLKNLPFSVKNDELKKYMEQFGPIAYAVVCIDPLTEHSKGTAFVKFQYVQDAERCLTSTDKLQLQDQIIEVHKALHKSEIQNKHLKKQDIKDSRNLYLIKEGVVLAKSSAAVGVSVSDMQKRLQLEQWKSQMLRNLNMFISRIRLVIYNLPPNMDNAQLKQLFKNHSGPKAVITEARVMRDLKNPDPIEKGKSKEYGFVSFTTHEDALKALRSINNNPNIFSAHKRPIIGFSIENRILINAKEKRIQKSRSKLEGKRKSQDIEKEKVPVKKFKNKKSNDSNDEQYIGIISKLGQNKLRSKHNLRSQAQMHTQMVKEQKKLNKTARQLKINRIEKAKKIQENMPLKKEKKFEKDEAHFNQLLNNYRNKLGGINIHKSKWYEQHETNKS